MAEPLSELHVEIETLENRHADHPEGRYFVPLANAYRKDGNIDHAETLLREGLRRYPDYLSAHIVLGRCLADRGASAEAEEEFRYVLSLDPQNLIALRTLGELAAGDGRVDEARSWYGELLEVDPMNEEGRLALESLRNAPQPEFQPSAAWWEPAAEADVSADESILSEGISLEEPDGVESLAGDAGLEEASAETRIPDEPITGEPITGEPIAETLAAEAPVLDEPKAETPPAEALPLEEPPPGLLAAEAPGTAELLSIDDVSPAGIETLATSGVEEPTLEPMEPGDVLMEEHDPIPVADGPRAEPVFTETIAELYARQGLSDRAAEVYRELIRRRGGDASLEARLAEVEGRRGGMQAPAAVPPDEPDSFAASFGGGFPAESVEVVEAAGVVDTIQVSEEEPTIGTYLKTLVSWRPSPAAAEDGVRPERGEAAVSGWLDSEAELDTTPGTAELAAEMAPEPTPVAEQEIETRPDPSATPSAADEPFPWESPAAPVEAFSFDEAFPQETVSGSASPEPQAAPWTGTPDSEPAAPEPPRDAGPADTAADDDLESFQAWLRSLKR